MDRNSSTADCIRSTAEANLAARLDMLAQPSAERLLHELQVHQVELEMQFEELRQSHAELDAIRAQYFDLYDHAPAGYCTVSEQGQILQANLTAASLLGLARGVLLKQSWLGLIFEDDREIYYLHQKRLVDHGVPMSCEVRMLKWDGAALWVHLSATSVRDDAARVLRIVITDITARRLAQQALRESEQRLNFALKMSQIGGWEFDLIDHTAHRTVEHARIFGSESHLNKMDYALFLAHVLPEDRAAVDLCFRKAMAAQTGWDFECRIRRDDGEIRWIWATGEHQLDEAGQMRRVAGVVQDITARKHVEEERALLAQSLIAKNVELELARAVAEKANRAKSDFLSGMSHELRSPLNAILGFAQLLEAGKTPPTAGQSGQIREIIKAGWYLLGLINEILDLSAIESNNASLTREPIALIEVMRESQAMVQSQAAEHDIDLNFLVFDPAWCIDGDRTRVKQVLINLLSNAIKYNRQGGTVQVRCFATDQDRIRISVKDSGLGLSADKLLHLFEPFNRLGQEVGGEEGTGIGLVVTKRLVELMGGSIGVDSSVGVGSEFWFELPRVVVAATAASNPEAAELSPPAHVNQAPRTVLYVEDSLANLMLVEQIVEDRPQLRMLSARDANLGIALARTHRPDVILMDINLPGISGIEAMKILREEPATAHIPMIALSANAMLHDREKGLAAGFFRYLTKPIRIDDFLTALDDAMESTVPQ